MMRTAGWRRFRIEGWELGRLLQEERRARIFVLF